jgi:hypothetical protein
MRRRPIVPPARGDEERTVTALDLLDDPRSCTGTTDPVRPQLNQVFIDRLYI